MQERRNSIANTMELRRSCTNPTKWCLQVIQTDQYTCAILPIHQGWGQFHFFNSIPIPLFPIPIPIPIPLLTISFNSNSNSNSRDFNSNSNSRDFKSNLNSRNDLLKSSAKLIIIDLSDYNSKVYVVVYKIIVINTISLISLVKWLWIHGIMADVIPVA